MSTARKRPSRPAQKSTATKPAASNTAPPKPSASPPSTSRRRSGTGAYIGLAIAAVVVVIAVVAVLVTRSSEKANAGPQTYPVTVTGTPLPQMPDSGTDSGIGATAPKLTGQSLFGGSPLTIDPADGKSKLIVLLAHWCPHCQAEVPRLVEWMGSGQMPADLSVYAVSTSNDLSDVNAPASAWLQREKWSAPVLADSSDSTAANAYGLTSFPYLVVVGPDGTVKARKAGEMSVAEVDAFVKQALGA